MNIFIFIISIVLGSPLLTSSSPGLFWKDVDKRPNWRDMPWGKRDAWGDQPWGKRSGFGMNNQRGGLPVIRRTMWSDMSWDKKMNA